MCWIKVTNVADGAWPGLIPSLPASWPVREEAVCNAFAFRHVADPPWFRPFWLPCRLYTMSLRCPVAAASRRAGRTRKGRKELVKCIARRKIHYVKDSVVWRSHRERPNPGVWMKETLKGRKENNLVKILSDCYHQVHKECKKTYWETENQEKAPGLGKERRI